jgi:hypothetical protein
MIGMKLLRKIGSFVMESFKKEGEIMNISCKNNI